MRGPEAAGFCPLGTPPPARRPRSLSSLSRRRGSQGAGWPRVPPAIAQRGRAFLPRGTETDTDSISPTPVIARGQELWPRSPPVSTTAHTRRCSIQQKIQNLNACPHPLRGSGGHLWAPTLAARGGLSPPHAALQRTHTLGSAGHGLRAGSREVTEPVPPRRPPSLCAARLPPARPPGW